MPAAQVINLSSLGSLGFKIKGDRGLGFGLDGAGDVNGDGFADIIVGAHNAPYGSGAYSGAAYVIFGKASGFGEVNLSTLAAADGFKISGAAAGDEAGYGVSAAGDVNGDGYDDYLVGAIGNDTGGSGSGTAYVLFGKPSGLGNIDLANLAPADGFKILGEFNSSKLGGAMSAGDLNGDGYDDLVLGSFENDSGGLDAGAAFVVFGKASGFADIDLGSLSLSDGFKIQGDLAGDVAGNSISSGGDVNGDGYDDLIIGAPRADSGGNLSGAAYLIFGKATGFANIDLSSLAAADGFRIQGAAGNRAGDDVSFAGDINNDGYDDLIVGAPTNNTNGTAAGAIYVLFGKASGLGDVNLATLAPADGFRIFGENADDHAGRSVSAAGDVNGDGYDDLLIGAQGYGGGLGVGAGAAYVIFGKASGFADINLATLSDADGLKIVGEAAGDQLVTVAAAGDINNDGYDDILVGGSGQGEPLSHGQDYIIFGSASFSQDNILTGTSNETLAGGAGNDTYFVSSANVKVVELQDQGNDVVYTSVSYALLADSHVETLSAANHALTTPISLTGNGFANNIYGNIGNNVLDGGGGADAMLGFAGNDIFFVDNAGDVVVEHVNEGNDVVYTSVSYTLAAGSSVETLSVNDHGATSAINLTGNGLGNNVYGNSGANTLNGGGGADLLYGFGGADTFAFTSALGGGNSALIADFVSGTDKIGLDDAIFTGLGGPGALSANAFFAGTAAHDADDRIIYDSSTGALYYDADGNGAGAQILFATLYNHPVVTASDFQVI